MNKRATPKYKYQNLKDYLIAKIRSGGLAGSGRLDSEPQLCERFSLSRNTIRQAIQELENEGYVYRIHGKGTFIRNATPINSRKIALMIYDTAYMAHPVTGGLIRGIDETLSRNGYILDILASKRSFHDENLMRLAESYAGFLIGTYQLDELMLAELEKISLPHLFVKNYPMNHDVHAARINFTHAGFLAAEHLIRTGCGNLALIYSGDRIAISAEFKEGVYSAALEHGARLRRENIFIADFSDRLAVPEICAELLRHEDRPDGNDLRIRRTGNRAAGGVKTARCLRSGRYFRHRLQQHGKFDVDNSAAVHGRHSRHGTGTPFRRSSSQDDSRRDGTTGAFGAFSGHQRLNPVRPSERRRR